MKAFNKFSLSTFILGVFLIFNACGNKSSKSGETESETTTQTEKSSVETEVQNEVTKESTRTYIEIDMAALEEAQKGDRINLEFTDLEKSYELIVQRVQEQVPGIKSISANIENKETGLATMNLRDDRLSGIIDLYGEGLRYRIGYDSDENSYFVMETEVKSREERAGDDPMTPKMHDN